jgi:hypothetical protein
MRKAIRRGAVAALIASAMMLTAVGAVSIASRTAARATMHAHDRELVSKQGFHDDMRKLWEDHVTWTRLFIVSFAADLPDLGPTADRLLQNQQDIGDAIAPFYGEAAGAQLTDLLRDHILIAADVLAAAKGGDQAGLEAALERWYANGDDIAAFLHSANSKRWPIGHMEAMMREHLDLTLEEASLRLQGDYAGDIATYEEVHVAILEMADMLSSGIIKQFPGAFVR